MRGRERLEYGNEHEGRDRGENGSRNEDENKEESGGKRESGNLQSGYRGGFESAKGATPTSNQQPQPQDQTPQRDRRIIWKTKAQGREARHKIWEGGGEVKMCEKRQKSCRRDVKNGGDSGGGGRRRQDSVGSVDVDPEDPENRNDVERETQDAQSSNKNCRESVSPLSRMIKCFRNKYH